jgi:carbon-monoxide dehydrogenase medium subunit
LRLVGVESDRVIPAESFFTGPRQTVRQSGEVLTEIQIPTQPDHSGASYQRFSLRRGSALAVASVAAMVFLDGDKISDARVVLGSVAPVPLLAAQCGRILAGQKPTDELFLRAGKTAAREAQPITDIRGSEEYRRDLVNVLTIRALQKATDRARGVPA